MPWSGVQVQGHFEGKHCLQLEGQRVWQTSKEEEKNSTLLASCPLFGMFFMVAPCHIQEDGHCYGNLKSSFLISPAWEKDPNGATRPNDNFCFFFTSTVNWILVGMVFLGNDNIHSFILKKMRSVNLKAVISKFKITFHISRELTCIQTQERHFFSMSYGLKTPIVWKSAYYREECNAL
jgi:hypothetical protein